MKLYASLAMASALSVQSAQVWTSHPNYEACTTHFFERVCKKKFYTVTETPVMGNEVAGACAQLNAYPWCPESEEESTQVYTNMAILEHANAQSNLDIGEWLAEQVLANGVSRWTGVSLAPWVVPWIDPNFESMSKKIGDYVCLNPLKSVDGWITFHWKQKDLLSSIFLQGLNKNPHARCVAMGEQVSFKWGNLPCADGPEMEIRRRAVCVTTADMSSQPHYAEMDMEAPEKIKQEFKKILEAVAKMAIIFLILMLVIFTGCCFCCCCCCCFKPCRSGDSEPVVETTVTTQAAAAPAPAPAPYAAPPPAPAPVMPAYGAPPPAPYGAPNPYGAPAYGQPPMGGGMGGINMNISNNNTNANR